MSQDERFMQRAIEVALQAEREGNPPMGAVLTLGENIVAEGAAAVLVPRFDGTRHAEMEALRAVPGDRWGSAHEMSL